MPFDAVWVTALHRWLPWLDLDPRARRSHSLAHVRHSGDPMDGTPWLAQQFESHRPHLRGVAYQMLGSLSDADDAVQECWLRVERSGTRGVENLGGWLTTAVARVCLDMLRSRRSRRE